MASVKLLLRKNKTNKSGLAPIVIQLIHKKRSTEITTGKYLDPKHWDEVNRRVKPSYPDYKTFNLRLKSELLKYEKIIMKKEAREESFDLNEIIRIKKGKSHSIVSNTCLAEYIKEYVDKNPENLRLSTLNVYKTTITKIEAFNSNWTLEEVTPETLERFERFMRVNFNNQPNTIYNRLKVIRKIIKLSIRRGHLEIDPFNNYSLKKEKAKREYLDLEELALFEEYNPKNNMEELVKDSFLFSIYTGLRFSDICLINKNNIKKQNGQLRISLTMAKTKESLEFKLSDKATFIINKYICPNKKLLFPILKRSYEKHEQSAQLKNISSRNAYFNRILKKIGKKTGIEKSIHFHMGRHSHSCISLTLGVPVHVLQKILGHTSLAVTNLYIHVIDESKDKAIDLWNTI